MDCHRAEVRVVDVKGVLVVRDGDVYGGVLVIVVDG